MHDRLFETQDDWTILADPTAYFLKLVDELKLDQAKAKEAIEKEPYNDLIQLDINDANSSGVNATPTFYLNGKKLSVSSFDDLKTVVDKALIE